jgi:hypothetical protein
MATMPKLKVTYSLNNTESTQEIQVIFADMVKWDILRKRNNFPAQDEAPSIWMGTLAFAALVRTKVLDTNASVEDFLNTIVMIEPVDEPEAAEFPSESSD